MRTRGRWLQRSVAPGSRVPAASRLARDDGGNGVVRTPPQKMEIAPCLWGGFMVTCRGSLRERRQPGPAAAGRRTTAICLPGARLGPGPGLLMNSERRCWAKPILPGPRQSAPPAARGRLGADPASVPPHGSPAVGAPRSPPRNARDRATLELPWPGVTRLCLHGPGGLRPGHRPGSSPRMSSRWSMAARAAAARPMRPWAISSSMPPAGARPPRASYAPARPSRPPSPAPGRSSPPRAPSGAGSTRASSGRAARCSILAVSISTAIDITATTTPGSMSRSSPSFLIPARSIG